MIEPHEQDPDEPGHAHRRRRTRPVAMLATLLAAMLAFVLLRDPSRPRPHVPASPPPAGPAAAAPAAGTLPADDTARIAQLAAGKRSHVWVEVTGTVERVLRDDLEGSEHQRWILRLAEPARNAAASAPRTVLVSHNLDLAPRVPFARGDTLRVRGEYVWNPQGGLVHWTHHDPDGGRAGGWVEWRGRRYR